MNAAVLTITPSRHDDESPYTYLLRLSQVNGHQGLRFIGVGFGVNLYGGAGGVAAIATICRALGRAPAFLNPEVTSALAGGSAFSLCGSCVVRAKNVVSVGTKTCPQCMREKDYCRTWWDVIAYDACTVHGCCLLHQCQRCGSPIQLKRSHMDRCDCGEAFSSARTISAERAIVGLAEIVEWKLGGGSDLFTARALAFPVDQLANCSFNAAIHLVGALACAATSDHENHYVREYTKRHELLRYAAAALVDWPRGFHHYLGQMRDLRSPNGPAPSYHRDMAYLLRPVAAANEDGCLDFVEDEIVRFGYRMCYGVIRAPERLKGRLPARRFGSYRDAAVILNVSNVTAARFKASGKLDPYVVNSTGVRGQVALDLDAVRRSAWKYHRNVSNRVIGRNSGLPVSLVTRVTKPYFVRRFRLAAHGLDNRSVVQAFVDLLVEKSRNARQAEFINLAKFIQSNVRVEHKLSLLTAIAEGRVLTSSHGNTVESIDFPRNWRETARKPKDTSAK